MLEGSVFLLQKFVFSCQVFNRLFKLVNFVKEEKSNVGWRSSYRIIRFDPLLQLLYVGLFDLDGPS